MKKMSKFLAVFLCAVTLFMMCGFSSYAIYPSNPLGFRGEASAYSIKLLWDVPNENYLYKLYQKTDGKWVEIYGGRWSGYVVKNLEPDTTYTFGIRASYFGVNNSLNPEYKTIKVKTLPEVVVPKRIIENENHTGVDVAGTIKLEWDEIRNADGYRVYQKVNNKWKFIKNVNDNYCEINGLTANTWYEFAVKHFYIKDGKKVNAKLYGTIRTRTFDMKSMSYVRCENLDDTGFTLTWEKVPGATGYRIFKKTDGGSWQRVTTVGKNTLRYNVNFREASNTSYIVRAYAKTGYSGIKWTNYSNTVKIPAYELNFEKMSVLTAEDINESTLTLKWDAVDGARGYRIFKKEAGGSWKRVTTVGKDVNSYTIDRNPDIKTYYTVRAYTRTSEGIKWSKYSNYLKA